jgi:hypothetical protein
MNQDTIKLSLMARFATLIVNRGACLIYAHCGQ